MHRSWTDGGGQKVWPKNLKTGTNDRQKRSEERPSFLGLLTFALATWMRKGKAVFHPLCLLSDCIATCAFDSIADAVWISIAGACGCFTACSATGGQWAECKDVASEAVGAFVLFSVWTRLSWRNNGEEKVVNKIWHVRLSLQHTCFMRSMRDYIFKYPYWEDMLNYIVVLNIICIVDILMTRVIRAG